LRSVAIYKMATILNNIETPADVKALSREDIAVLADELREEIIAIVAKNGGHLASSLGAIEIAIALHRVFDSPKDKIIWDVGHQSYAHKLLTGRRKDFKTLRQYDGISGFTSRQESPHDPFGSGHASTSISAALGIAVARDRAGEDYNVIAVIGDGAITGGMSYEALNNAAALKTRIIVILNDNGMSISPTVGSLDKMLSKLRFNKSFYRASEEGEKMLKSLPLGETLSKVSRQLKSGIKGLMLPTVTWEEMGFSYLGPVDGHNEKQLETALKQAKEYSHKPTLLHVVTTKGKGYEPAENDAVCFHGLSPKAKTPEKKNNITYSQVFGETVDKLIRENPKLIAVTAAMPDSYNLCELREEFPDRVFDVGICEQHAVTFAAGIATQGYVPIVAIYSTFLQRAFDQIVHDVCIQNLPVVFAVDRAGIVGEDGKTHQGTLDISYLSLIPNMIVACPKDGNELKHLLYTAVNSGKPMAVRYPRGPIPDKTMDIEIIELPIGQGEILKEGEEIAVLALGSMVMPALEAAVNLEKEGINTTVVNARFAKPLDEELIIKMASCHKYILTIEENVLSGGFGSNVTSLLAARGFNRLKIDNLSLPDRFIEHGNQSLLRANYGLDSHGITAHIRKMLGKQKDEQIIDNRNMKLPNED
jgi:1-deoxy-D-xylulose-5-phosphate synthase